MKKIICNAWFQIAITTAILLATLATANNNGWAGMVIWFAYFVLIIWQAPSNGDLSVKG